MDGKLVLDIQLKHVLPSPFKHKALCLHYRSQRIRTRLVNHLQSTTLGIPLISEHVLINEAEYYKRVWPPCLGRHMCMKEPKCTLKCQSNNDLAVDKLQPRPPLAEEASHELIRTKKIQM
jgi:hypothetical protein